MPQYRRLFIEGGVYFFTLVTDQRQKIFSSPSAQTLFLESVEHVRSYHPFTTIAYCILPDHIHFIWKLPEHDSNYSTRISAIKRRFSIIYRQRGFISLPVNRSKMKRREVSIWQRRFWEHFIRDQDDFERHFDYLHFNPIKHGLVQQVRDWEASSFMEYVNSGIYDVDWGGNDQIKNQHLLFGE
jgi:putative transposase